MNNTRWTQRHPRWAWLALVGTLLLADQASKTWFSSTLPLGAAVPVTDWLNLVHVLNTGAAFSLLADAGGWQRWLFVAVATFVIGVVSWVCLTPSATPLDRWVGAFVVAGGGGNLIDRLQTGAVVDFLDLHWKSIHWPAFNLADIFVVCSMMFWCFVSLKAPPRAPEPSVHEKGIS